MTKSLVKHAPDVFSLPLRVIVAVVNALGARA